MINLCFFIHNLSNSGGTERITCSLADELARSGMYKVRILSLETFTEPFFPLHSVSTSSLHIKNADIRKTYGSALRRLRKFLRENSIDVLIDVDVILSTISIPAAFLTKTKVISWEHYNYYVKSESVVRRYARKTAALLSSALVTLTEQDLAFYRENCKCRAHMECIHNFVDERFKQGEEYASGERKTVLCVGHLEKRKGQDLLLKIWSLLPEPFRREWKLRMIGKGESESSLRAEIRHRNLSQSVEILPPTDHVEDFYRHAAVYVMTSRAEGLPMVLLEAKAEGLPIVAFDCKTGPSEIVRQGIDGFLIENFKIEDFALKLQLLLEDASLREKMSREALKDNRFERSVCVEKWEKLIRRIIKV